MQFLGGLIIVFYSIFIFGWNSVHGSKAEKQLIQHLLGDLEPRERPVENHNSSVTVTIGLYILRIDDVVDDMHHVEFTAWLDLRWQAYNLRWEPSKFDNIDSLRLDPHRIWFPDIYSYSNVGSDMDPFHQTHAVVKNNGKITYIPPAAMTNPCHLNGSSYPFEKLRCPIKFGSWTYDGSEVDLQLESNASSADTSSLVESPEWKLIDCPAIRTVKHYSCCPEPYIDVQFVLTLQRRGEAILAEAKSFSYFALGLLFMSCLLGPSSSFTIFLVLASMALCIQCSVRFDPKLGTTEPTELAIYFVRLAYLGFFILFTNLLKYHFYLKTGSVPAKVKQLLSKLPRIGSLHLRVLTDEPTQSNIQHNYNDLQELTITENQPKPQRSKEFGEWQQLSIFMDNFFFILWTIVLIIFDLTVFPSYEI